MKKIFSLFSSSILFVLLIVVLILSTSRCSPNTTQIVCDYGTVLCDVSTTMCNQIPGVPDQVCNYLNLACYNLNQLCELRDSTDSPRYEAALTNIQNLTAKLKSWNDTRQAKK